MGNIPTLFGWGIKDVDYVVIKYAVIDNKRVPIWRCPYYEDWRSMLQRCYSKITQSNQPAYVGCTVCEEWKYLSNFIKWVDSQPNKDWQNSALDKDILVVGNKVYSPDTCAYVTRGLNNFLSLPIKNKVKGLTGVTKTSNIKNPYRVTCCNPLTGCRESLGMFPTEDAAYLAWKKRKQQIALVLAEQQPDPRVKNALINLFSEGDTHAK